MKATAMPSVDDLLKGRHFDREIIILCARWRLRFKLTFRDLMEMMAERGLWPAPQDPFEENPIFLMLRLPGDTWVRLAIWLAIGLVINFVYGIKHSRMTQETEAPAPAE